MPFPFKSKLIPEALHWATYLWRSEGPAPRDKVLVWQGHLCHHTCMWDSSTLNAVGQNTGRKPWDSRVTLHKTVYLLIIQIPHPELLGQPLCLLCTWKAAWLSELEDLAMGWPLQPAASHPCRAGWRLSCSAAGSSWKWIQRADFPFKTHIWTLKSEPILGEPVRGSAAAGALPAGLSAPGRIPTLSPLSSPPFPPWSGKESL